MLRACKLCHDETKLRRSHIIPEFLYSPMYDEKHRFNVVSNVHGILSDNEQKGLREYLLCPRCEDKLNKWETYAARILYGRRSPLVETSEGAVAFDQLEYAPFKLFLLSLIWRAGVSSLIVFAETRLGAHEEKMRKMLLNEDPGSADAYGCLTFSVRIDGQALDGAMYGPQPCDIDGIDCYRLLARGLLFIFFVSSTPPPAIVSKAFLSKSGKLSIPAKELRDIPFLDALCEEISRATGYQSGRRS